MMINPTSDFKHFWKSHVAQGAVLFKHAFIKCNKNENVFRNRPIITEVNFQAS